MTLIYSFSSTYLYSIPCKVLLSVWLLAQGSSFFLERKQNKSQTMFCQVYIYILRLSCSLSDAQSDSPSALTFRLLFCPSASDTQNESCASQIYHCPPATCGSIFMLLSFSLASKESAMQVSPRKLWHCCLQRLIYPAPMLFCSLKITRTWLNFDII